MREIQITLILICFFNYSFSQYSGLSKDHIDHIKKSTVKIIENGQPVGTGFFINQKGQLVTCFHVVNYGRNNDVFEAEFTSGEKIILKYSDIYKTAPSDFDSAMIYDFVIMELTQMPKTKYQNLKLGSWSSLNEGNFVYTCGYPLGINQQFVSTGILSTKYFDSVLFTYNDLSKGSVIIKRSLALIDFTLNKGNSGGAVVLMGATAKDDAVIGIADFTITPYGYITDSLINSLNEGTGKVIIGGVDPNKANSIFAQALKNTSMGISGCISVEYLKNLFKNK